MNQYAIALGMFDGVHLGHRAVLNSAISSGFISVAVTFNSLPIKAGGVLMTPSVKEETLKSLGVEIVDFLDFESIKDLEPTDFLDRLCEKYKVGKISCGFNYRFGKHAEGDTTLLRAYCQEKEILFDEIPPVTQKGTPVSSSLIKELLKEGETEKAEELLGEPFFFTAKVEKGDRRGRTMGFPTANQKYPENYVTLKKGVYQTVVTIGGKSYDAVTNIGVRPTYPKDFITAESHIINYCGDCYGKEMKTQIIKFLREEKVFANIDELKEAIAENLREVKENSKAK